MTDKKEIPYKQELLRKGIHLFSLSIPVIYIFVTREFALFVLVPLALIAITIDLLSQRRNIVRKWLFKIFGRILRSHEINGGLVLNGASWVLISAVICVFVFPKSIFVPAFSILIISDSTAALIGRKFGKTGFMEKSLEGSIAFFISAILVIFVLGYVLQMPWTFLVVGSVAAFFGTIAEASAKTLKVDDNLSIPVSIGIIMWIGDAIMYNLNQISFITLL